ncbi:MAG: hypothetical protein HY980_04180 [Candidatus Magasanikbacteria bacterium]|nr:hypothetical protein [Candidatus Magasanikbacteria bacterium]
MLKNIILFLIIFCLSVGLATPVFADYTTDLQTQLQSAAGTKGASYGAARDPREVAALVVQVLLGTLGVLFTVYIVYAGFLITTAAGEQEKVDKGKRVLRHCVIGLLITFGAFSITLFLNRYLIEAQQYNKPTTPLYAGSTFKVDEDTSQFYNKDPLSETINEGTIW